MEENIPNTALEISPPSDSVETSIFKVSTRTAAILMIYSAAFTALMAATYTLTKPALEASAKAEKLQLINAVLAASEYDNALVGDVVSLPASAGSALGLEENSNVYRARKDGKDVALIVEAAAADGYSGHIGLLLAVRADGRLAAVRVTSHKETPGLGDYIDPKKDRNKAHPWITQFNDIGFDSIPAAQFKVKKDGGHFDSMSGATISARAVTNATRSALGWINANKDALFALPVKATLSATPKEES